MSLCMVSLDDVDENPYSPVVTTVDRRTRPSTRDWLFKVVRDTEEADGWPDKRQQTVMLAMVQHGGFRLENFEEYIRQVGAPFCPALGDVDGSLWIWVQLEHFSDLELMGLLLALWKLHHPYVYTAKQQLKELGRIRSTIEYISSQISLQHHVTSIMQAEANGSNINDELPAQIPAEDDECVEELGSESDEWQSIPD